MNTDICGLHQSSRRQFLAFSAILPALTGLAGCGKPESSPVDAAHLAAFWALRLPAAGAVSGKGEVALAGFRGRPLLVNFWATWCPPCVAEMPMFSFAYAERGSGDWQCLGLAVEDKREPVERFLARAPVSYPVALAGLAGVQISRSLGNAEGALPFSVLFAANGQITRSKIGQLQLSELKAWLG